MKQKYYIFISAILFTLVTGSLLNCQSNEEKNRQLAVQKINEANELKKQAILFNDSLHKKEKYYEALNLVDEAIKLDPNNEIAYSQKISIYGEFKDYKMILHILDDLKSIKGEYPELVLFQGMFLAKLHKKEEAKQKFIKALDSYLQRIKSDTSTIFYDRINIAYLYMFLDEKEKSQNEFDQMEKDYPSKKATVDYEREMLLDFEWDKYFEK